MAVTVRLPSMFHATAGRELQIDDPVHDIAGVREVIERRYPDLARELSDPMFNVAVNDVMLLHGVRQYPVKDGDVVEIVPTVAGGSAGAPRAGRVFGPGRRPAAVAADGGGPGADSA